MLSARFPGKCAECRKPIAAGDQIHYDRQTKQTLCVDCAPPDLRSTAPAVVHVALAGQEVAFRAVGRLSDEHFGAVRRILTGCRFKDGVNYVVRARAATAIAELGAAGVRLAVEPDVRAALDAVEKEIAGAVAGAEQRTDAVDALLAERGGALYRYQREGVAWLAARQGALVADDMGLGKTIQALTALPAGAPVIVVCPAIAKPVWRGEAARWRPDLRVTVLEGRGSFRAPKADEIVVINPDILSGKIGEDAKTGRLTIEAGSIPELLPGTCVIVDEAHVFASSKSQRTLRMRGLAQTARDGGGRVWLLTATPLKNQPLELWNVLRVAGLEREAFGSWFGFLRAFSGRKGKWGGFEWGTPSEDAPELLRRVSIRRRKTDVLADLPAKTHRTMPAVIDRETAKLCDEALAELDAKADKKGQLDLGIDKAVELLSGGDTTSFEKLSAARAALAKAKIPTMLEVVETYEQQGEPLVVFSAYRAPIDTLAAREGWAAITGDTAPAKRGEIVDAFQAGKLKGVACTIRAGGVAITLTRASNVLRVDREWNPSLNVQAEDRCYRIGQKSAVLVTDLVAAHRLDERIAAVLADKERLIAASVDASTVQHVDTTRAPAPAIDWAALEQEAARALRDAKAAAEEAATAKDEHERKLAQRRVDQAKGEARRRVRAAAARRLDEAESDVDAPRRGPISEVEQWAIVGLRQLAVNDPDRAQEKNEIGFSASDGDIGHALAWLDDLTDQEWRLAVRIARHYPGQIGRAPELVS